MKYLVNRETKEHIVFHADISVPYPQWGIVEADSEGWIPWNGGECPLPASNQAEVKLQDGKQGSFDSIPLMTHRSWQKWNCGGDIVAYRPILAEKEEAQPKSMLGPDFDFTSTGKMPYSAHSPSVFDRLKSAIAASASIPAIIAEIDALLPDGYHVTKRPTHRNV